MRGKLTPTRVKVIAQLFQFDDINDQQIADMFRISKKQINHIRNGQRWTEVTGIKRNEQIQTETLDFMEYLRKLEIDSVKELIKQEVNHQLDRV